ncbi:MAG TPA: YceI family protein [Aggregatilineales bacterium]|nr:YceI family protein [Aggregatilineales bacterium]
MAWVIDNAHTSINFAVKHMMISTVRGTFGKFSGTVNLNESNPAASTVEGQVEAASISTNEPNRDGHLRSADFLDAEKYPAITFKGTRIVPTGAGKFDLYGNLTIKDVTLEFVFHVSDEGKAVDPFGKTHHAFIANAVFSRKEFGLTWNVALETGGWLVGEDVKIDVELELVKVEQPEAVHA